MANAPFTNKALCDSSLTALVIQTTAAKIWPIRIIMVRPSSKRTKINHKKQKIEPYPIDFNDIQVGLKNA